MSVVFRLALVQAAVTVAAGICSAAPAPIVVNSKLDLPDATPLGDGVVDADLVKPGFQITLRAAVMECNALPGTQLIQVPPGTYRLTRGWDPNESSPADTGGLDVIDSLVIEGTGPAAEVIVDAKDIIDRIFTVDGAVLQLSNLTIRNGFQPVGGGGILAIGGATLSLTDSIVTKCQSDGYGGGIAAWGDSPVNLNRVILLKNRSKMFGGGVACGLSAIVESQFLQNHAEIDGGGLFLQAPSVNMTIVGCTFSRNKAEQDGGGIAVQNSFTRMINCTFDRNEALGQGGGGISCKLTGGYSLESCTLARNKAAAGSGIFEEVGQLDNIEVIAVNTIMANEKTTNYAGPGLSSLGHNIDNGTTCGFTSAGDLQNTNPRLATKLKKNGGPTPNLSLKKGSPAIDAGDDALAPLTDQRLLPRVDKVGLGLSIADIGAFEAQ